MTQADFTSGVMVAGLRRASDRYDEASSSKDRPGEAMCALFEALNWAVAIAGRLKEEQGSDWPDGLGAGARPAETLRAIQFARNRVHHHWPDALELNTGGFSFPLRFPINFFEWRWRAQLEPRHPPAKPAFGEDEYLRLLAGRPARISVAYVGDVAAAALGLMDLTDSSWGNG